MNCECVAIKVGPTGVFTYVGRPSPNFLPLGSGWTDNRIIRADGTTGIQDGPALLSDTGELTAQIVNVEQQLLVDAIYANIETAISVLSPLILQEELYGIRQETTISANTDNLAVPGVSVLFVNCTSAANLTGIVAPVSPLNQRVLFLRNVGTAVLTLVHDATSTAANRFYCPRDANFQIAANQGVTLIYDVTDDRWGVFATGDVSGPASATDNTLSRYDGTSGKLVQGSGVTVDDSNNVTGVVDLTMTGNLNSRDPDNLAAGPGSATDNAVARFDGTGGKTLQNSVFVVADAGAVTGVTTIVASSTIQGTIIVGTTGVVTAAVQTDLISENTPAAGVTADGVLLKDSLIQTANAVGNTALRDSGACSVIGRSANSSGDPADISASTNGQVLRRSADVVGFGAVDLADTDAVTGLLPVTNGGMGVAPVKITSDQTNSTLVLANATGLSFSVTNGRYYHFRFVLVFRSAATTTGMKVSVTTPTFTVLAATTQIPTAAESSGRTYTGWITSSGDTVTSVGVEAATTDYLATINGVIVPSADGTLQLQFASEVDTSTITLRQGSMGFLWDLGT